MHTFTSILRSGCFHRKGIQALGLGLGVLLLCLPAFSQLNLGSIAGTVTDATGAVIAGARVTVTDVERNVSRTLTTDSAGQYSAPSLTPGSYTVRAEFKGFQALNRTGITVGVGQTVRVDLAMQPGSQIQTVTVTEAVPLVDVSNEVLSTTVEDTQLSELPINGKLYTKVLDFQPGVHGNPGGNSPNYQTNGAGGQGNYFMLDGVENSNVFVNSGPLIGAATSTDELTILPQDAVEEVNVMTNPPAEFGWFQGAVVNVGLKSGTNSLHGSGYLYARNNNFDVRDPYLAPTVPKQPDDFKQFGGSIGGPIKKDKLFFFGAYDGMRYNVGIGSTVTLPSVNPGVTDNPANSVPLAIQDMINNHGVMPSQLSLNLANCTVAGSAPSAVATCGTKGVFRSNGLTTLGVGVPGNSAGHSNNGIGRVDYHPNSRNSINGEYFFGQAQTSTPNAGEPSFWNNLNLSRTQMMRAVWINTPNSNWVNDLRFGYNRYNLEDGNAECSGGNYSSGNVGQPNYAALGFISGANPPAPFCGFPAVNFTASSYPSFGALSLFISDQGVFQYTYTIYDNASYTHGSHNFKFGFEYHHSRFRGIGAPGFLDGVLNFNGGNAFGACGGGGEPACPAGAAPGENPASTDLQDFLNGAIGQGNQILVNPNKELSSVGFNREALYFEDNFRVSPRVTMDLGLRYELEPAILIDNNAAGNFGPNSPTGMVQQNGSPLYQADHHAFAPRAGVAWDLTGKGTTVLRAGMGVSYDTPQIDDLVAHSFGAGLNVIPTGFALYNDAGLVFPASTNPQAVKTGVLTIPASGLNWVNNQGGGNTPVFPASLNTELACGTGNPAITLPGGVVPSPCTLKARGTVIKLPNGQLSMNTSNARSPMYTWTLGIQHAFKANTSLTVNYVGTHAYNLADEININQAPPGDAATVQQRQPYFNQFPWLSGIFVYGPGAFSNYNALQVTFVQRNFHGLTINAAYTFSRDLAVTKGGNDPYITNSNCVACDYGLQTPTQDLGITLVYALPGMKSPAQLLEGWQISSAINAQSGQPFRGVDSSDDFAGVNDNRGLFGGTPEPWSLFGSGRNFNNLGKIVTNDIAPATNAACMAAASAEPINPAVPGSSGLTSLINTGFCYVSPNGKSVIVPPAQGTFGNMRTGALLGPPFHEWDLSLRKSFRVRERLGLEFSLSAFNVLNNHSFALGPLPAVVLAGIVNVPPLFGLSSGQANDGNPINGTGGARQVLLGLKATF
jgi:Carboxypeptidase regulatory-like domain